MDIQLIFDNFIDLMNTTDVNLETSAFRLVLSVLVGGVIGFERQRSKHSAGFRTFTLICVGSTIMMLISLYLPQIFIGVYDSDPTRMAGQAVTGIGFLGAGAIIQSKGAIRGMTTAASIWIISALGLAIGAGMYTVALIGTIVTLFVLINLANFEKRVMVEWTAKNITLTFEGLEIHKTKATRLMSKYGLSVHDVFIDQDLNSKLTHLHFSVYVKIQTDYENLFTDLRQLPQVTSVRLWA